MITKNKNNDYVISKNELLQFCMFLDSEEYENRNTIEKIDNLIESFNKLTNNKFSYQNIDEIEIINNDTK